MATAKQTAPSGPRAGFWPRFGEYIIDSILLGVVNLVVDLVLKGGVGIALSIILDIAYYVSLEGGPSGQTLGKRALGIRVVSFDTGGQLGYPRALIRYIGKIISGLVIFIGYLWMIWDPEKQTWHDKMASSVVVPVAAYPTGPVMAEPPYPQDTFSQ
ncbi:MAG: RDD family protein [Solirubrobacteraceae bacterium]